MAATSEPTWILAITCRCLTEDLGFGARDCERPVSELAELNSVVADFVARRAQRPIGAEVIQSLAPKLIAYSLHSRRYRGATWHQEDAGIVWLLAAHLHRADSAEDAYPYFARLQQAGRLLPTREDFRHVTRSRPRTFQQVLREDVPRVLRAAVLAPGTVREVVLGGKVRIRVMYQDGGTGLLSLAISTRLLPGTALLPKEWFAATLAAFFPHVNFEDIAYVREFADGPLQPDEVACTALIDAVGLSLAGD